MTNETLHQRMIDRLFSVFRDSPNVQGFVQVLSGPQDDTWTAIQYYLDNTDLDDCEGVMLDFRGWLIGAVRPLAQELDENLLWLCPLDFVDVEVETRGMSTLDQDDGGYMTGMFGIKSKELPGTYMGDDDYRKMIKTKAATFRKRATLDNIFTMCQGAGFRVEFTEGTLTLSYTPASFDEVNYWVRNYITSKGFKPAGIKISFDYQTAPEDGY